MDPSSVRDLLYAGVMELVYMYDWGSYAYGLRVRVPSPAFFVIGKIVCLFLNISVI